MHTNVQNSSLDAFFDMKVNHKLQEQQLKILNVMQVGVKYTRRQLADLSGLETSTTSARINSMLDIQVVVDGSKVDPLTGKNVQAVRLK